MILGCFISLVSLVKIVQIYGISASSNAFANFKILSFPFSLVNLVAEIRYKTLLGSSIVIGL